MGMMAHWVWSKDCGRSIWEDGRGKLEKFLLDRQEEFEEKEIRSVWYISCFLYWNNWMDSSFFARNFTLTDFNNLVLSGEIQTFCKREEYTWYPCGIWKGQLAVSSDFRISVLWTWRIKWKLRLAWKKFDSSKRNKGNVREAGGSWAVGKEPLEGKKTEVKNNPPEKDVKIEKASEKSQR